MCARDSEPNLLVWIFIDPGVRVVPQDWEAEAAGHLARFHALADNRLHEPAVRIFVEDLRARSKYFDALWLRHDVGPWTAGTTVLNHLSAGATRYDLSVLVLPDRPDQRLLVFSPQPEVAVRLCGGAPGLDAW